MQSISGRIVTHNKDYFGTIFFDDHGFIHKTETGKAPGSVEFSDDCIIFPGFGDIHIHAREDASGKHTYKEDFISAGNAAINGGVTHVADMPNNPIPPIDDDSYSRKMKLSQKSPIYITLYAGIGPKTNPLIANVPYKVFMGPSIGELFFTSNRELEETLARYQGKSVSFHCEDPEILAEHKNEALHENRRPPEAEIQAAKFAIYLIEKYKLQGKLCHFSTGDGLKSIREAKKKHLNVTCEVTPTHLFFDLNMLKSTNRQWMQMNPPLRSERDREEMMAALLDGTIDFLATDHAPHSIEEKLQGISGISQLDTYSLFVTWLLNIMKVKSERIAEICSKNPGDFVKPFLPEKLKNGFGYIEEGYAANFSILNLKKKTHFTRDMIQSKSGWSPFEGFTFPGAIEAVYYMGKKVR